MSSSNDDYQNTVGWYEQIIGIAEGELETSYRNIEYIQSELDEVLESLDQDDDRKINVTDQKDEFVDVMTRHICESDAGNPPGSLGFVMYAHQCGKIIDVDTYTFYIFEKHSLNLLFGYMKDFFDITDDELESKQHRTRFALEIGRVAHQILIKSSENEIEFNQKKLLKLHKTSEDVEAIQDKSELLILNHSSKIAYIPDSKTETESEQKKSKSEQSIDKQFKTIRELETRLRELLANIFSREADWWKKFVPLEITEKCQYRNRKDPDFERIQKEQSSELIDKLMFKELQIIITGSDNDNFSRLFRNVFDSYHYVNSRLIEASILRNQICHMNELNPKKQMQLENIKSELVYDIDEYLKSG